MKDDDIWRRLYYQRFVSEDARRIGIVPVLVEGRIYCRLLSKCGHLNKFNKQDDSYDDDRDSDHDRDSVHDYDRGYDGYYDYGDYFDDYCTGMEEKCGFFSTWLSVFKAEVRYAKSKADLSRYLDSLYDSFMREERINVRYHVGAPNWWMMSPHF